MREKLMALIIFFILSVIVIASCNWYLNYKDNINYNNGICTECGGCYNLYDVIGHRQNTGYIYKCDTCNNCIETHKYMK